MKNNILKYSTVGAFCMMLVACAIFKSGPPEYAIDLVCNMKVQKSEAYTWKYEGKRYYFDTYTCKESFKMNPKKFVENKCTDAK
jgi:YHS domain-containing protein